MSSIQALPLLALIAAPYLEDCNSPTQYQCAKALASIQAQQSICNNEKDPICEQIPEWEMKYRQKCDQETP